MGGERAKDLAEGAVAKALAAGASYAEARVQSTWDRQFVLKNGEPQPSFFAEGYGIGIRVISRGALGFAATNDMSRGAVNEIARKAVKLAKTSSGLLLKPVELDRAKAARRK
jgi:TldD protein